MSKKRLDRPIQKYDFSELGKAIKNARISKDESRKAVSDDMFISPRYLANIENKGQQPSLQIFYELVTRYNISVDQYFFSDTKPKKDTERRRLDALLDTISEDKLRYIIALAEEISKAENEK